MDIYSYNAVWSAKFYMGCLMKSAGIASFCIEGRVLRVHIYRVAVAGLSCHKKKKSAEVLDERYMCREDA